MSEETAREEDFRSRRDFRRKAMSGHREVANHPKYVLNVKARIGIGKDK